MLMFVWSAAAQMSPRTSGNLSERKVVFTEKTAMRLRRGGFSEVTVTSRLTDRWIGV